MYRQGSIQSHLNLKDKIFSLDLIMFFCILILGIISFFAMYSTERGNFNYYTQSHVYRFFTFFFLFSSRQELVRLQSRGQWRA